MKFVKKMKKIFIFCLFIKKFCIFFFFLNKFKDKNVKLNVNLI